jgi:hypothetical protein
MLTAAIALILCMERSVVPDVGGPGNLPDSAFSESRAETTGVYRVNEHFRLLTWDAKTQFLNVIASFETTIARNRVF